MYSTVKFNAVECFCAILLWVELTQCVILCGFSHIMQMFYGKLIIDIFAWNFALKSKNPRISYTDAEI